MGKTASKWVSVQGFCPLRQFGKNALAFRLIAMGQELLEAANHSRAAEFNSETRIARTASSNNGAESNRVAILGSAGQIFRN
jgi:hypothetical protein